MADPLGSARGVRGTTHPPYDYASEPDPRKSEYVLGPSDIAARSRCGGTRISRPTRPSAPTGPSRCRWSVISRRRDGRPGQLRAEIVQRLGDLPQGRIGERHGRRHRHQQLPVRRQRQRRAGRRLQRNHFVTVSEAMALAGGPNRFASPEGTLIIRGRGTDPARASRSTTSASPAARGPQEDLPLLPGDRVYVP